MNFKIEEKTNCSVYGKLRESLFQIFLNIWNLENQRCWFGTQKVKLHPNKAPTISLLDDISNEKTIKLIGCYPPPRLHV